jgi:NADPH-dependent 2,4-dienoyl-CoA reductase/sulfur reductase-like enzyme
MSISRRNFLKMAGAGAALASLPSVARAGDADPVVVIGGGYAGATVAKYLRLWSNRAVQVTLVDPNASHTSCIMSNLVLNGRLQYAQLQLPLSRLSAAYGVKLVQGSVSQIDPGNRQVLVESVDGAGNVAKSWVAYSRLVVATGIEFDVAKVPGWNPDLMPHAWVAGPQTLKLRDQLSAMPASGTFVMTIPPSPYRCPPGPYERACIVADVLKRRGGKPKVVVLDANPEVQAEKDTFMRAFSTLYAGIVDYRPNAALSSVSYSVDPKTKLETRAVVTSAGTFKGDVVNVIGPHQAAKILRDAGFTKGGAWAPVDPVTYASTVFPNVHVIGDAQGTGQPKSGHMANSQAKVCADAVLSAVLWKVNPYRTERLANLTTNSACYSPVNISEASYLTASFRYDTDARSTTYKQMKRVWLGEAEKWTTDNYQQMFDWASNLMTDSFTRYLDAEGLLPRPSPAAAASWHAPRGLVPRARVGHAFLDEAVVGRAGELLRGGLGFAPCRGVVGRQAGAVVRALLHEAGPGRARQLLLRRLGLARGRGVLVAFLHEARARSARKLLSGGRVLAGRASRGRNVAEAERRGGNEHVPHGDSPLR